MPRVRKYLKDFVIKFSENEHIPQEDVNKQQDYFALSFNKGTENESTTFLPNDVMDYILLFVPAYPYYFTLRRVSKQWKEELEERVFFRVEVLDLIPRFFKEDTIQYKEFLQCGRNGYEVEVLEAFKLVIKSFPNVKHIITFSESDSSAANKLLCQFLAEFPKLVKCTLVLHIRCTSTWRFDLLPQVKKIQLIGFNYISLWGVESFNAEVETLFCTKDCINSLLQISSKVSAKNSVDSVSLLPSEDHLLTVVQYYHKTLQIPFNYIRLHDLDLGNIILWSNSDRFLQYLLSINYQIEKQTFIKALINNVFIYQMIACCEENSKHLAFAKDDVDEDGKTILLELLQANCNEQIIERLYHLNFPWQVNDSIHPLIHSVTHSKTNSIKYILQHEEMIPFPKDTNLLQLLDCRYKVAATEILTLLWPKQKQYFSTLRDTVFRNTLISLLPLLSQEQSLKQIVDELDEQVIIDMMHADNSSEIGEFILCLEYLVGKEQLYSKTWHTKNLLQMLAIYHDSDIGIDIDTKSFFKQRIEYLRKPILDENGEPILIQHVMNLFLLFKLEHCLDIHAVDPKTGNTRLMQEFSRARTYYAYPYTDFRFCNIFDSSNDTSSKEFLSIQNKEGKNLSYLFASSNLDHFKTITNSHIYSDCLFMLMYVPLVNLFQKANDGLSTLALLFQTQNVELIERILQLSPDMEEKFAEAHGLPILHFLIDTPFINPKYLPFIAFKLKNPFVTCENLDRKPNALQFALCKQDVPLDLLKHLIKHISWNKSQVSALNESYLELALHQGEAVLKLLIKQGFDELEVNSEAQQKKLLQRALDKHLWSSCLFIAEQFGDTCISNLQQLLIILKHRIELEGVYSYSKLFKRCELMLGTTDFYDAIMKQESELEIINNNSNSTTVFKDAVSLVSFAYYHLEYTFLRQIMSVFKSKGKEMVSQITKGGNSIMHLISMRQQQFTKRDHLKYKFIINQVFKENQNIMNEVNAEGETCFHLLAKYNHDMLLYLYELKKGIVVEGLELLNREGKKAIDLITDSEALSFFETFMYPKRKRNLDKANQETEVEECKQMTTRSKKKKL